MSKRIGLLLALFGALTAKPVTGQIQDNGGSAAAKPATAEKTGQTAAEKEPDAAKKPKKIWTNDEVGLLKGSVSVVGGENKPAHPPAQQDADGDGQDPHAARVQQYRDTIEQCRSQIAEADSRIAQLKDFKAENTNASGGINLNGKYNMVPPEEQVKQLEARKKQLQANIEDLENQARKEGIDPGELR